MSRTAYSTTLLTLALAALTALLGCGAGRDPGPDKTRLVVWNVSRSQNDWGEYQAVLEFGRRNPDIELVVGSPGGRGGMDPQKLMTAIAGGRPPDVVRQDRFAVGQWAARGAFLPLDSLVKAGNFPIHDFYDFAVAEATHDGRLYAIPWDTDARALYVNRKLLAEFGLDPDRPPADWDELTRYAIQATEYNQIGRINKIGFLPARGNAGYYMYSWLNGGSFMSPDGRTCTFNTQENIDALRFMVSVYDTLGGRREKVGHFESSLTEGSNIADPFLLGRIAMKIDGNWNLDLIGRHNPDLDFAVYPPPAPKGRPTTSWSGGFSLVIPRGCRNVEAAWRFIEWIKSEEAYRLGWEEQRAYNAKRGYPYFIPKISTRRSINDIARREYASELPRMRAAQNVFYDLLEVSHFRPVTPVGQLLWDEQVRAFERASYHVAPIEQILEAAQTNVQNALDNYFAPKDRPIVRFSIAYFWLGLLLVAAFIWYARKLYLERRESRAQWTETRAALLFISPWTVGFLLFTLGPIIASIIFSFTEYDVLHPAEFVGWENYKTLLGFSRTESGAWVANDPLFWKSLWNTLYIVAIGVPLNIVIGLGIALMLNKEVRGMPWYRTAFFIPSIVPAIATAILWSYFLRSDTGFVNEMLAAIGIGGPNWLMDARWTKVSLLVMLLWGVGGGMVIWLAGLKNIPRHFYEAADIDGAGNLRKFVHVTLPIITPHIFFNLVMGIIAYFQIFTQAYVLIPNEGSLGGPEDSLLFYVLYLFFNAFQYFKLGYASAMAWILFIIILALTLFNFKLAPRWVYYLGGERN